jgi:Gamma-glutamyl cyclotransferase, AIG2-like
MIPAANSHVDGMIWLDLSDVEMKAFDYFEDVDYQRRQVQVSIPPKITTTTASSESDLSEQVYQEDELVQADAYIWTNPSSELELQAEWSYEIFCKEHLDWYLSNTVESCRRGLDRLKQPEDSL